MLALTRKINERIVIDKCIIINISEIRGGSVKIAISAPKEMEIDREEIFIKKYPMNNLLREV